MHAGVEGIGLLETGLFISFKFMNSRTTTSEGNDPKVVWQQIDPHGNELSQRFGRQIPHHPFFDHTYLDITPSVSSDIHPHEK